MLADFDVTEIIKVASSVTTPLGLAGLAFAFGFFILMRHVGNRLRHVESALPADRVQLLQQFGPAYNIPVNNLSPDQAYNLLREEVAHRHSRYRLTAIILAVCFVICFIVSAVAFLYPTSPQPTPNRMPLFLVYWKGQNGGEWKPVLMSGVTVSVNSVDSVENPSVATPEKNKLIIIYPAASKRVRLQVNYGDEDFSGEIPLPTKSPTILRLSNKNIVVEDSPP